MCGKLLTVVVPAYNVENYLDECLHSFIDERVLEKVEVLVVNDGSTDETAKIASRYEHSYPQTFRLITKENGGHGSTINRGLAEAQGTYFKVVDGDDWVDTDNFVRLVRLLGRTDADIVASNYTWIDHETKQPTKKQEHPFNGIEYGRQYDFSEIADKVFMDIHAMTVRTDTARKSGEKIDEHTYYVDVEYVTFPIPYVETVLFQKESVYRYRLGRPGQSMSIEKMQKNLKNHLRVLLHLNRYYEKVKDWADEDRRLYMNRQIAQMLTSQMKIYISFPMKSKMRKEAMKLDAYFYHKNRDAYDLVTNPAVLLLRKTNYAAFPLAVLAFKGRRDTY